eukprot:TRINITY_DN25596_c0_g1_i2.p1 TRINITY_DN25596_c0_g1~~TRINITY_DN25596_c0_g1_i2.p1  ORF type:complete len:241 (+),score=45.31 TRINITY_DN25596_c0_g1_i2:42-725(+)
MPSAWAIAVLTAGVAYVTRSETAIRMRHAGDLLERAAKLGEKDEAWMKRELRELREEQDRITSAVENLRSEREAGIISASESARQYQLLRRDFKKKVSKLEHGLREREQWGGESAYAGLRVPQAKGFGPGTVAGSERSKGRLGVYREKADKWVRSVMSRAAVRGLSESERLQIRDTATKLASAHLRVVREMTSMRDPPAEVRRDWRSRLDRIADEKMALQRRVDGAD